MVPIIIYLSNKQLKAMHYSDGTKAFLNGKITVMLLVFIKWCQQHYTKRHQCLVNS